ncbi:MAG: menaquinone biosynthesis protein [Candidatus Krumholzibacteriota bacterium]|nr:menaquinone biosynthesis protein [Candidatus Krumholzibacteriota bacterium]
MNRIRIGVIDFANALPLAWGLVHGDRADVELVHARPGVLADRLRFGELDAALIPAVEFFRGVGAGVVPGLCIGSRGPVASIRFLARRPLPEIDRVLVDRGSRTSVAMLRLLLERAHRCSPDFHTYRPDPSRPFLGPDGEEADAALVIGDLALELRPDPAWTDIDLGDWWEGTFHRPFVYAVWAARSEEQAAELTELLQESHRDGERELPLICEEVTARKGWPELLVHEYFTRNIRYRLDDDAVAGLRLFHRLCVESYLAPRREAVTHALEALAAGAHALGHASL